MHCRFYCFLSSRKPGGIFLPRIKDCTYLLSLIRSLEISKQTGKVVESEKIERAVLFDK